MTGTWTRGRDGSRDPRLCLACRHDMDMDLQIHDRTLRESKSRAPSEVIGLFIDRVKCYYFIVVLSYLLTVHVVKYSRNYNAILHRLLSRWKAYFNTFRYIRAYFLLHVRLIVGQDLYFCIFIF